MEMDATTVMMATIAAMQAGANGDETPDKKHWLAPAYKAGADLVARKPVAELQSFIAPPWPLPSPAHILGGVIENHLPLFDDDDARALCDHFNGLESEGMDQARETLAWVTNRMRRPRPKVT
ncbi:hypothetical protein ACKC9G_18545 [Pokkaliibacter sp. CJK22405]|uniref:hypothetical protein n=1 Tax=Pokkaliibacter sp. CJK22405 TaxID=3384615 RepID=UPI0039848255